MNDINNNMKFKLRHQKQIELRLNRWSLMATEFHYLAAYVRNIRNIRYGSVFLVYNRAINSSNSHCILFQSYYFYNHLILYYYYCYFSSFSSSSSDIIIMYYYSYSNTEP
jgi:hypothetical protein